MEKVRISKLLSQQGICSRREADSYIERGWVFVDGVQVTELGTRAFPNQTVTLNQAAQKQQSAQVTILLNKPIGYVSGQAEQGYKPPRLSKRQHKGKHRFMQQFHRLQQKSKFSVASARLPEINHHQALQTSRTILTTAFEFMPIRTQTGL